MSTPTTSARHQNLTFRVYSIKELACLYYPDVMPATASRNLRKIMREDPLLRSQLEQYGFRPRMRTLTPRLVSIVVEHLGSPSSFEL